MRNPFMPNVTQKIEETTPRWRGMFNSPMDYVRFGGLSGHDKISMGGGLVPVEKTATVRKEPI